MMHRVQFPVFSGRNLENREADREADREAELEVELEGYREQGDYSRLTIVRERLNPQLEVAFSVYPGMDWGWTFDNLEWRRNGFTAHGHGSPHDSAPLADIVKYGAPEWGRRGQRFGEFLRGARTTRQVLDVANACLTLMRWAWQQASSRSRAAAAAMKLLNSRRASAEGDMGAAPSSCDALLCDEDTDAE